MYEQTFQLTSRPFNNVPTPEHYFASSSSQQALDMARMCIDRSTGPVVLVGSVGMGKSLMLQMIGQSFGDRFDVVQIECSRMEQRSELLQSILFELDLPYSGLSEGELRLTLMGHLKKKEPTNDGMLLLVDEADRLSVELIEELRLVTNQVRQGRSVVQLVLAGTQRLEETLNDPKLASFNQRISVRSVLQSLTKKEIEQFVYEHIERAGRNGSELFNDHAIDEIWTITDGCPRVINQLCDQSLILAASRDHQPINRTIIREVWAEMQNMPGSFTACPNEVESSEASESTDGQGDGESQFAVVEFGQLDDGNLDDANGSSSFEAADQAPVTEEIPDPFSAQPPVEQPFVDDSPAETGDALGAQHWSTGSAAAGLGLGLAAAGGLGMESLKDPFAPQDEVLADGNTESARIESLQQEQEELFHQTGRHNDGDTVEFVDNNGAAADEAGNADEGYDMIPADPFRLSVETEDFGKANSAVENVLNENSTEVVTDEESSRFIDAQFGLVEETPENGGSFEPPAITSYTNQANFGDASEQFTATENSQPANLQPVEPAVDPFAEPFEEEEMLQDAYSPFVAKQNQSSLGVTSADLSQLTPIDEEEDNFGTTPAEEAIDDLDSLESITQESAGTTDHDVAAIGKGDFVSEDPFAEDAQAQPEQLSNLWQDDPATAFTLSADNLPPQVDSSTPSTFVPTQSVPTEIGATADSSDVDPDLAKLTGIDTDLEALTSDLQSATTFDETLSKPSTMMDLNDLVPGHMLAAKEDEYHQSSESQNQPPHNLADDSPADSVDNEDSSNPYRAPQESAADSAKVYSPDANLADGVDNVTDSQEAARRKAEDFLRTLHAQRESAAVEGPQFSQQQYVQSPGQAGGDPSETDNANEVVENTTSDADDGSHVLKEIFRQQQIIDQVHFTQPPEESASPQSPQSSEHQADSYSVEYPVTEHESYQQPGQPPVNKDDRDMLYVNQSSQYESPEKPEEPVENPLFPQVDTSTGNANRMDYNQLFDQLRNVQKD